MSIYFLVWDATRFDGLIRPALAASWRRRSFEPCQELWRALEPGVRAFTAQYRLGAEEPLLSQAARGLPFDRNFWRLLVAEVLLFGADAVPELQTTPELLCRLLAPDRPPRECLPREDFAPVHQAYYGARDLVFGGGFYRPDSAGYNASADVDRLAAYLASVCPDQWSAPDLGDLPEGADAAEREEELAFAREWFPPLQDLYQRAREENRIVVCEVL
jgi:hypothetical protein